MAGWKLRKDKASAETPGEEFAEESHEEFKETAPEEMQTFAEAKRHEDEPGVAQEPIMLDAAPSLPSFDSDTDLDFTKIDFDTNADWLEKSDEPLTLVDYSEPAAEEFSESAEAPAPEVSAPGIAPVGIPSINIPPVSAPSFSAPSFSAPSFSAPSFSAPSFSAPSFSAPSFSAPSFSAPPLIIPAVAPFVLDTPPAAPQEAAPQVIVRIGRLSAAFALAKEVTTIGRPDSILHYYPDIEIEMDDAVSRRHAEILKRTDGFYIADAGSTNGTLLNGEMLPAHDERLLAHGDRIRVGDRTEIVFE